jgi:hypothetical protein
MITDSPRSPAAVRDLDSLRQLGLSEQQPERLAPDRLLSLTRIAATLQVALATRRAARTEEHAYWYTVLRGM